MVAKFKRWWVVVVIVEKEAASVRNTMVNQKVLLYPYPPP